MKNLILYLIIFISYVLTGCVNNQLNEEALIEQETFVVPELLTESQFFEISTVSDTVIVGRQGTKISIPKNSFGQEVESVKIELQEYYNMSDMLLKGLCTVTSKSEMIETDGMIYLSAKDISGKNVFLDESKCIIEMPMCNQDMLLFYGKEEERINWVLSAENVMDSVVYFSDTLSANSTLGALYNKFEITQLGWINADKFIDCENKTDLFVSLPENQKGAVYSLAFYNYNSILPAVPNDKGQLVFKGVPANEKVTLMGIGSKDDALYYSSLNLSTDTKNAKLPTLKKISKDELQAELENNFGNDLAQRPQPRF